MITTRCTHNWVVLDLKAENPVNDDPQRVGEPICHDLSRGVLGGKTRTRFRCPAVGRAEDLFRWRGTKRSRRNGLSEARRRACPHSVPAHLDDGIVEHLRSAWSGRRPQLRGICDSRNPCGQRRLRLGGHRTGQGAMQHGAFKVAQDRGPDSHHRTQNLGVAVNRLSVPGVFPPGTPEFRGPRKGGTSKTNWAARQVAGSGGCCPNRKSELSKAPYFHCVLLPAGPIATRFLPERLQIDCFILTAEG